jgi:hypothetical protein
MKIFYKNLLVFLLLIPTLSFANKGKRIGKHTKEKNIHKEFLNTSNTKFDLTNLYGNIDITSWDGDKITIDTQIIVNGDNKEDVIDELNNIYITYEMNSKKNILTVGTYGTEEVKYHKEIHYQIKVPKSCPLKIYNQFGNISIDETNSNANLFVSYGNLIAGKLNGNITKLYFGYSTKSKIEYVKNANIWGSFSDYEIEKSETISLENLHSSNTNINHVKNFEFKKCSYGTIIINKATNIIKGQGEYLTTIINNFSGKEIDIKSEFGAIDIKKWETSKMNFDIHQAKLSIEYSDTKALNLDLQINSCSSFTSSVINYLPKSFVKSNNKKNKKGNYKYHHINNKDNQISILMTKGILRFNKVDDSMVKK